MIQRREILDSDDDGGEFSPVKAVAEGIPAGHFDDVQDTPPLRGTDSTDLSFFQRVYDEQENAATSGAFSGELVDDPGNFAHPDAAAEQQYPPDARTTSSLTSVTGPVPKHRKAKKAASGRDLADLTQVTTPTAGLSSGRRRAEDVWDIPSSPVLGPRTGDMAPPPPSSGTKSRTKTHGKRKREQLSSSEPENAVFDSLDPAAEASDAYITRGVPDKQDLSSSLSLNMERGGGDLTSAEHAVADPMAVPRGEHYDGSRWDSGVQDGYIDNSIPDIAVEETPASLYVAPSALTASQKQEYQVVSLSPEAGLQRQEQSFPPGHGFTELGNRSSGTTIAYPTPTQYASSGPRWAPGEPDPGLIRGETTQTNVEHPLSSPDIISISFTGPQNKRGRSAYENDLPPSEASALPDTKRTKRSAAKGTRYKGNSGLGDGTRRSDDIGLPNDYRQRPSRRRSILEDDDTSVVLDEPHGENNEHDRASVVAETAAVSAAKLPETAAPSPLIDIVEPPATESKDVKGKRKRGRKKKEVRKPDAIPEEEEAEQEAQPEKPQVSEPDDRLPDEPAKKKRGRPRKSEIPNALDAQSDQIIDLESGAPAAVPVAETGAQAGKAVSAAPDRDGGDSVHGSPVKPAKRGRKKKQEETRHKETARAATEEQVLGEISQNSRSSDKPNALDKAGSSETPLRPTGQENATAEKPAGKEAAKETAKTGQNSKAQYRVGLSKRSRIAPLLKIIRK